MYSEDLVLLLSTVVHFAEPIVDVNVSLPLRTLEDKLLA